MPSSEMPQPINLEQPRTLIVGGVVLPDTARLREKLAENIIPIDGQSAKIDALLQFRADRLPEMERRVTLEIIHALEEQLTKRATNIKPYKKQGRTGWRGEFIREFRATRAGPALNRMAIHFILGQAPLRVYKRYGVVSLGPTRDKMNGKGEDDPPRWGRQALLTGGLPELALEFSKQTQRRCPRGSTRSAAATAPSEWGNRPRSTQLSYPVTSGSARTS